MAMKIFIKKDKEKPGHNGGKVTEGETPDLDW